MDWSTPILEEVLKLSMIRDAREIIIKGEYRNGQKFGRWDTVDIGYKKNKVMYFIIIKLVVVDHMINLD